MTLKEQIIPHSQYWDCYNDEPLKYDHTNKLVKIAEEFAIGFNNWCIKNYHVEGIFAGILDEKELLNDYKKEQGL